MILYMLMVLIVFFVSCTAMITLILTKPKVKIGNTNISIYWLPVFIGAMTLILVKTLTFAEIVENLTSSSAINPLKILVLFLSMTFLSIFLDEVGFFKVLASKVLEKTKADAKKIFLGFYFAISALTIVTSNDIIILTFTPFICYFTKKSGLNPIPFLVSEFVAANTWSMALIIGNPTNIYLATASNITFFGYMYHMLLPTLLAGIVSFLILWMLFKNKLKTNIVPASEPTTFQNKALIGIGLIHLSVATIMLIISSYIKIEMWLISLVAAVSLILSVSIYSLIKKCHNSSLSCFKKVPAELVPFVLSMFVFVLALEKFGVTTYLNQTLNHSMSIISYGISSTLIANLINNIPMSVLYGSILGTNPIIQSVYATIIGSNIGAFLTPMGALAGIMWLNILKQQGVKFSFFSFVKYGVIIAVPTLFSALLGLKIIYLI